MTTPEAQRAELEAKTDMWKTLNMLFIKMGILVDAALDKIAEDAKKGR